LTQTCIGVYSDTLPGPIMHNLSLLAPSLFLSLYSPGPLPLSLPLFFSPSSLSLSLPALPLSLPPSLFFSFSLFIPPSYFPLSLSFYLSPYLSPSCPPTQGYLKSHFSHTITAGLIWIRALSPCLAVLDLPDSSHCMPSSICFSCGASSNSD
jgi:hypothetical protein